MPTSSNRSEWLVTRGDAVPDAAGASSTWSCPGPASVAPAAVIGATFAAVIWVTWAILSLPERRRVRVRAIDLRAGDVLPGDGEIYAISRHPLDPSLVRIETRRHSLVLGGEEMVEVQRRHPIPGH